VVIAVSPGMVPTDMTAAFPEGFLQLRPELRDPGADAWREAGAFTALLLRIAAGELDRLHGPFVHVRDDVPLPCWPASEQHPVPPAPSGSPPWDDLTAGCTAHPDAGAGRGPPARPRAPVHHLRGDQARPPPVPGSRRSASPRRTPRAPGDRPDERQAVGGHRPRARAAR
jgi:hypothetical protein